ncbi:MAG: hypothetical protein RMJ59_04680 [Candidatus Nitrosocaldus sp.]|nr:hypothetical protein [Candidatus Nitrosocaldus sp.]
MSDDWKQLTKKFVDDEEITHMQNILKKLIPNLKNLPSNLRIDYEDFMRRRDRKTLYNILEYLANQYSTFTVPAMITRSSASNFYLYGEKNAPNEQEGWKTVYMLFSAVPINNILMNLDSVKEEGRKAWRQQLVSEDPKQFYIGIRNSLDIKSKNWGTFFTSLVALSYFVYKTKNETNDRLSLAEWSKILSERYGFNDDTTLIIYKLGKEKKEVHYFSKITMIIQRWFNDYIEGREDKISLLRFLDSLTTTYSNKINQDIVMELREKLAYYLLKYNIINGELLTKLIVMRVNDSLDTRARVMTHSKHHVIVNARQFFTKL